MTFHVSRIFHVLCAMSALVIFAGCEVTVVDNTTQETPEDPADPTDPTDPTPITGLDVGRAPAGVGALITQDIVNDLLDTGMNLYQGDAPPTVVGRYRADTLEIVYDDVAGNPDSNIMPYEIEVMTQDGSETALCQYQDNVDGSECTVSSTIVGSADCFTIVSDYAGRTASCEYDRTEIVSGCLTADGDIADYQNASILTGSEGECGGIRAEGDLRVMQEGDGLAAKVQ